MEISKLVITPAQSRQLLWLGINAPAFLCHYKDGANPEHWVTAIVDTQAAYETLPAWTKEEIDAMIGPEFSKPDLWKPDEVTKSTDPESYPVYFPNKMKVYKYGAQASADALIFLLQNKHIHANDANSRYVDLFLKNANNIG